MSCEDLVCARCANPVVEGRCESCRKARLHMHERGPLSIPPMLIAGLLLAIAMLLAVRAFA